jgi:hypothetical protein
MWVILNLDQQITPSICHLEFFPAICTVQDKDSLLKTREDYAAFSYALAMKQDSLNVSRGKAALQMCYMSI